MSFFMFIYLTMQDNAVLEFYEMALEKFWKVMEFVFVKSAGTLEYGVASKMQESRISMFILNLLQMKQTYHDHRESNLAHFPLTNVQYNSNIGLLHARHRETCTCHQVQPNLTRICYLKYVMFINMEFL
ncbi:hypothetical protein CHS0354_012089 [Potamilus streckersoni]|uniref:Uncharacterized protein n=1 Tax=Potamilus streckersoni TaxID=2493646 RepID=A0AAE0VRL4_9BIVA|nr:hypothetical protein CHS0354_012089 [Potamilus streckersoni]